MFKSGKGTAFAIGLIFGLAIAVFVMVWAIPEFRNPSVAHQYYENWKATSDPGQNQNPDDAHFWIRELYGWVYAEDTLAQWLMATLGFAATVISGLALYWLKRTWNETWRAANAAEDSAAVTRRIGEAQVRAYLTVPKAMIRLVDSDLDLHFKLDIKNTGQSPARDVSISFRVNNGERHIYFLNKDGDRVIENTIFVAHKIGAGEPSRDKGLSLGSAATELDDTAGRFQVNLEGYVAYRTVFDDNDASFHTSVFCFRYMPKFRPRSHRTFTEMKPLTGAHIEWIESRVGHDNIKK